MAPRADRPSPRADRRVIPRARRLLPRAARRSPDDPSRARARSARSRTAVRSGRHVHHAAGLGYGSDSISREVHHVGVLIGLQRAGVPPGICTTYGDPNSVCARPGTTKSLLTHVEPLANAMSRDVTSLARASTGPASAGGRGMRAGASNGWIGGNWPCGALVLMHAASASPASPVVKITRPG